MSSVFKALSDPSRRRVLELLRDKDMSAGELAQYFEYSRPTMSAHFSVLKEAGLVKAEKHGKHVIYRLQISVLEDALLGFAKFFGLSPDAQDTSNAIPENETSK